MTNNKIYLLLDSALLHGSKIVTKRMSFPQTQESRLFFVMLNKFAASNSRYSEINSG
ncbi:hypothetical protein [Rickettsia endosymbiont of Ceutorhynchus obstrictus]|uniref:hypothetical protein n=1 Tax=Rickettsia endosymbiont of Ceutorhynchus obstrictus TaxID=3066249 RepID=UPI003132E688